MALRLRTTACVNAPVLFCRCRDVARRNMHAKSEGETYGIIF